MLKPPKEPDATTAPPDQPIGDLFDRLIDDGKAYARAELNVAKAVAEDKIAAFKWPVAMIGAALIVAQAAVTVLAVGIALALAPLIGPLLAGLAGFLIFGGLAAGMTWWAVQRVREEL